MNQSTLLTVLKELKATPSSAAEGEDRELLSRLCNTIFQHLLTKDEHSLNRLCCIQNMKLYLCDNNYIAIMPTKESKLKTGIIMNVNNDCNKLILEVPHLAFEEVEYVAETYFKSGNFKLMLVASQTIEEPRIDKDICYSKDSQFQDVHCLMSTLLGDHVIVQLHCDSSIDQKQLVLSNGYGRISSYSSVKMLRSSLLSKSLDIEVVGEDSECCNTNVQARSINYDHDSGRFVLIYQHCLLSSQEIIGNCLGLLKAQEDTKECLGVPSEIIYNDEAPRQTTSDELEAQKLEEEQKSEEEKALEEQIKAVKRGRKPKATAV